MNYRAFGITLAAFVFCFACVTSTFSQSDPEVQQLKKEVEILKQMQTAIIMELRAIRAQVPRAQPRPAAEMVDFTMSIDGAPRIGARGAKIAIIEFSDFECPFCARHFETTLREIERDYVDTGKVVYVLRDFPIPKLHPHAMKAAEAAHCAGDQGKFWEMHALLFTNHTRLERSDLMDHAQLLGLDLKKFQDCLDGTGYAEAVKKSMDDAEKVGVNSTPTFFLGLVQGETGTVKAVMRISGAYPYSVFKEAIESLMNPPA